MLRSPFKHSLLVTCSRLGFIPVQLAFRLWMIIVFSPLALVCRLCLCPFLVAGLLGLAELFLVARLLRGILVFGRRLLPFLGVLR